VIRGGRNMIVLYLVEEKGGKGATTKKVRKIKKPFRTLKTNDILYSRPEEGKKRWGCNKMGEKAHYVLRPFSIREKGGGIFPQREGG